MPSCEGRDRSRKVRFGSTSTRHVDPRRTSTLAFTGENQSLAVVRRPRIRVVERSVQRCQRYQLRTFGLVIQRTHPGTVNFSMAVITGQIGELISSDMIRFIESDSGCGSRDEISRGSERAVVEGLRRDSCLDQFPLP